MKTPEELKNGLDRCFNFAKPNCKGCPYLFDAMCRDTVGCEAFAYINQLANQLRDVTKMVTPEPEQKWISIKGNLPKREKYVLTVDGHGFINMLAFWKKESNEWTWIDTFGHFNHANDITHWMPISEPPTTVEMRRK